MPVVGQDGTGHQLAKPPTCQERICFPQTLHFSWLWQGSKGNPCTEKAQGTTTQPNRARADGSAGTDVSTSVAQREF